MIDAMVRRGVFTTLSYEGGFYGVPLNGEDGDKWEVVLVGDDYIPVCWDHLSKEDVRYGLLGGGVKTGERLDESMWREFVEELGGLVGDADMVTKLFAASVFSGEPRLIREFMVMQARLSDGLWDFRSLFRLWQFQVELTCEQFEFLNKAGVLVDLSRVDEKAMRPYARAMMPRMIGDE